jgi:hyperosmotically inducible protein
MKINTTIAAILLVGASLFSSCKSKDVEIKSNVSDAVQNNDVAVTVKDGVVTLSGEVDNPAEKAKAEVEARKVKDVQTVVNEITLPAPPPPPSPEVVADEKLNAEVQAVIAPFPDVRASVSNGVVTLSGEITRPGLVLLMPKIAGLFPRKIENNIKIK